MITGWRYWYRWFLGWFPLQPCMACWRWYWGGLPFKSGGIWWQACYKEYCSRKCYEESEF